MSTYKITRLIRSALRLAEPCEIDGILFDPGVPFQSEQVRVSETLSADSYRDASKLFDRHLLPVVDAVTIMTGAALSPLGASTLIQKRRSKYVYLHAVRRDPAGHLTLVPSYHSDMMKRLAKAATHLVAHAQHRYAAHYLRQSGLAEYVVTAAFYTLQAAEALSTKGRKTNRTRLRHLMGDELFGYFYERDPLLAETRRNALAHGSSMKRASSRSQRSCRSGCSRKSADTLGAAPRQPSVLSMASSCSSPFLSSSSR